MFYDVSNIKKLSMNFFPHGNPQHQTAAYITADIAVLQLKAR